MSWEDFLSKVGRELTDRADQRRTSVDAVYDDQLWTVLQDLGLLEALDAGTARCHFTNVVLTRENLGGIVGTPDGPRLIADIYTRSGIDTPD